MIHITLDNGQTLLYAEEETVVISDNSEYRTAGLQRAKARLLVKCFPFKHENYLVKKLPETNYDFDELGDRYPYKDDDDFELESTSPIRSVKKL